MTAPPKAPRRRLVITLLALALGLLAPELTIRWLLFGKSQRAQEWGESWRHPGLYSVGTIEEDYWKLDYLFFRSKNDRIPGIYDEKLGWVRKLIEPVTYAHRDDKWLKEYRPILLYGGSFAGCMTEPDECFQGLLKQSEHRRTHRIINYGVGGYGAGQICELMTSTVDRYDNPLVVVAWLVNTDADRAALSFRQRPKPYVALAGDGVAITGETSEDIAAYIRDNPVSITSYAWNFLLYGSGILPDKLVGLFTGRQANVDLRREISRRMPLHMHQELEARGIEHFFLVMFKQMSVEPDAPLNWRERVLLDALEEQRIPHISARAALEAAGEQYGFDEIYIQSGQEAGHPNALGNEAIFEALLAGMRGELVTGPREEPESQPAAGEVPTAVEAEGDPALEVEAKQAG